MFCNFWRICWVVIPHESYWAKVLEMGFKTSLIEHHQERFWAEFPNIFYYLHSFVDFIWDCPCKDMNGAQCVPDRASSRKILGRISQYIYYPNSFVDFVWHCPYKDITDVFGMIAKICIQHSLISNPRIILWK